MYIDKHRLGYRILVTVSNQKTVLARINSETMNLNTGKEILKATEKYLLSGNKMLKRN